MPTRKELHTLVGSLPEGAMEAAHRILMTLQVWPQVPPPGLEEMRRNMRTRMEARRAEVMQHQKPGTIGGFGGSGDYDMERGVASSSFSHWDGDTFVAETLRRHKGREITVVERIRVDGQGLVYKHEVTGPDNKRDEREITFDIS